ncbi:dTDP-4-dehydrorhamnose reductase [Parvibium lacunae]|uniref:dTDP-4-dehydrorhamnose reductase n=1 Tax=Parvibium lacunae TaxID=1888893 RepID=A0A368L2R0_9BURK|nr:dTDP-4-dehydrorhamnose reductase [Parvibium lacunae]RCS57398.1 dTDP-4-dehydrorhamnose reductase [Parvibium lacunae]
MTAMRLLLLGKSGRLGRSLLASRSQQRSLDPRSVCLYAPDRQACDLAQTPTAPTADSPLQQTLATFKPTHIINAAAYTAVDRAETEPALAHTLNCAVPNCLAHYAAASGAYLIHYSTDYVFDGSGTDAWPETAHCAVDQALSVYGRTKAAGDQTLLNSPAVVLILRSGWLFGHTGPDFVKTVLRLAHQAPPLKIVNDQWGTPTPTQWLAHLTWEALSAHWQGRPWPARLYHCSARGETTWYDYACWILDCAHQGGWPLQHRAGDIIGIGSDAAGRLAQRPRNARLDCRRLDALNLVTPNLQRPDWRQAVAACVQDLNGDLID